MFRRIDDFAAQWASEADSTLKVFRALTDTSLSQAIVPGGRTLGFLAWHITGALGRQLSDAGLKVDAPQIDSAVPARAEEIAAAYERVSKSVLEQVQQHWTDDMLAQPVAFFGRQLPAGMTLEFMIRHQSHHRGQMTVLMRQAGLPLPGVYGPSKEEWSAMGMEAMA